MWELIYEDTFGFGEDRDPPVTECRGDSDVDGFFSLWEAVLREGVTGPADKPVPGFARFTLVITRPDGKRIYISIDMDRYINKLSIVRQKKNSDIVKYISASHYELYMKGIEDEFWSSLPG